MTTTAPSRVAPRDYQVDAIDTVVNEERMGTKSMILSMPTGSGKTVVAAHLISQMFAADKVDRTVFMVHRDELVQQSIATIGSIDPSLSLGVVKAEQNNTGADVIIASAQTLAREARLNCFVGALAGQRILLISDECHHDRAPSRERAIAAIDPQLLVGLTATAGRGDGLGLDAVYEKIAYHLPMLNLIARGLLADLYGIAIQTGTSLDGVHTRAGELAENELDSAVNNAVRNELVLSSWRKHASDRRRTVAFCVTVDHATKMRDVFRQAGVSAEMVIGTTPSEERQEILGRFNAGDIQVLTNVGVLTEGYDEPAIDCILMARPTKSHTLYVQCVGRGARTSAGKLNCMVLDFVDNTSRHSLVTLPSLAEVPGAKPVGEEIRKPGEGMGLTDMAALVADQVEVAARRVDLFGRSPLGWNVTAEEIFMASAGPSGWVTIIERDGGYMPALISHGPGQPTTMKWLFDRPVEFGIAQGIAESSVDVSHPLVAKDARWRLDKDTPPTKKQVDLAAKIGISIPAGASKSDVSKLVDEVFFSRSLRRLGVAPAKRRK